jgi:hypothetical protein
MEVKETPMRIRQISFSILILVFLLLGCANLKLRQPKTLEDYRMPTDKPNPPTLTQTAQSKADSKIPPDDCPVTTPQGTLFNAPAPFTSSAPWEGIFWFGTEGLWTALSTDGVWADLPLNPDGYTQKIMWWSNSFSLPDELQPALVVAGRRLDGDAPALRFYGATNAFADDIGEAMLTGVEFPTLGCWEVRGEYKKNELTFVVWVAL